MTNADNTEYRYRVTDADGKSRGADFAVGAFRTAPAAERDFTFVFSGDTHARHRPFRLFDLMRVVRERTPVRCGPAARDYGCRP